MTTLAMIWSQPNVDLPDWAETPFTGFCLDSRQVQAGQIFIALQGEKSSLEKSQHYIGQALAQGALGVLAEMHSALDDERIFEVANLRQMIGDLQRNYLQAIQAQSLARVVAVTGTNGKTTVSRLIAELLTLLGQKTAVMGTTGNGILPHLATSTHTTLDALQLQQAHYDYSQQGAGFLALEASSHGLVQGRLAGMAIELAVFTNLTRDHLDYHLSLDNYAAAKAQLFDWATLRHAVINVDADYAALMLAHARKNPAQPTISTYSRLKSADYSLQNLSFSLDGAKFCLLSPQGEFAVQSPLLGQFNVDNLVAAIIAVERLGFALQDIVACVPQLQGAPGRMQTIADNGRLFIVDYAHTPDALAQVLQSVQHHVEGKLWAVFGCGGDRDRGKRPLMTQAALQTAQQVILTSDNPRTEDPAQIFADMTTNIEFDKQQCQVIEDRRLAIKTAVAAAKVGDIVVIAGKGHENYQEIDGVRHWFDDVVEVQAAIAAAPHSPISYPAD